MIEVLFNQKSLSLTEAVLLYKQSFKPSLLAEEKKEIEKRLKLRFPSLEDTTDWTWLENSLYFTPAFMHIFHKPEIALWVAYECLSQILEKSNEGVTDSMQVFTYNRRKCYVKAEDKHIVFLIPEDY